LLLGKISAIILIAVNKRKKVKTYEDYLAQIPKSWDEPLREIHAIRWMHYEQERKKLTLEERVAEDQKEMKRLIRQLGLKYKALI